MDKNRPTEKRPVNREPASLRHHSWRASSRNVCRSRYQLKNRAIFRAFFGLSSLGGIRIPYRSMPHFVRKKRAFLGRALPHFFGAAAAAVQAFGANGAKRCHANPPFCRAAVTAQAPGEAKRPEKTFWSLRVFWARQHHRHPTTPFPEPTHSPCLGFAVFQQPGTALPELHKASDTMPHNKRGVRRRSWPRLCRCAVSYAVQETPPCAILLRHGQKKFPAARRRAFSASQASSRSRRSSSAFAFIFAYSSALNSSSIFRSRRSSILG